MEQAQRLEFETLADTVEPGSLTLRRISGRERLSQLYEYELELRVETDGGLAEDILEDLLRKPCRVAYGRDGRTEVHGILRSVRMISASQPFPVDYRVRLVPKLWIASQVCRSRVFQDLDVRGIVTAVLKELGFEEGTHFEWILQARYPVSEYTVQYQETDLDFIQRLLEHHGIFYYFVQLPDGERICFGDENAAFTAPEGLDRLAYFTDEVSSVDGVHELHRELTPQPTAVLLRDYNWRTPSVSLQSEAKVDTTTGRGFVNRYGEHFKTPAEGDALARVRAEELVAARDILSGRCRVMGLSAGHHFELSGHPLGDLDRAYLVTAIELDVGVGATEESRHFTAIPFDVAYRPPRRTPKTKIEGIMHARVDGEVPGTAAPIDEYGRYRLLLPFDLAGTPGGRASRWVRLAQPSSGAGYGIHFPLHIGAEVALAHIDGDPDRPIIMNSPPNAETITPVNDVNPTQSQIITQAGIRLTWDDDC